MSLVIDAHSTEVEPTVAPLIEGSDSLSMDSTESTMEITIQAMSGSGTALDPFLIATAADLQAIGTGIYTFSSHYLQVADIDWATHSNEFFTTIGGTIYFTIFSGTYDGNGFSIHNLKITGTSEYIALFGYPEGATLKNINFVNAQITGQNYCAILAGRAGLNTIIKNCTATGTVTGTGQYVGGLVGLSSTCYMEYCNANCTVQGSKSVGGIVGHMQTTSKCYRCYSSGSVVVTGTTALGGGFVGALLGTCSLVECYSISNISGIGYRTGGLVGNTSDLSIVQDCYAMGTVHTDTAETSHSGGLIGTSFGPHVRNSYSTGAPTGTSTTKGGLRGYAAYTAGTCYWDKETSGMTGTTGSGTGKTTLEMYNLATYVNWPMQLKSELRSALWSIDASYPKHAFKHILQPINLLSATSDGTKVRLLWELGGA